jgi:hypothetical protein
MMTARSGVNIGSSVMSKPRNSDFTEKEAQERFEAALRGGLNTPHKLLKEKAESQGRQGEIEKN